MAIRIEKNALSSEQLKNIEEELTHTPRKFKPKRNNFFSQPPEKPIPFYLLTDTQIWVPYNYGRNLGLNNDSLNSVNVPIKIGRAHV